MKPMTTTLLTTAVVLIAVMTSSWGSPSSCDIICAVPEFRVRLADSSFHHCHCEQQLKHTTAAPLLLTTDVCDYLCSIQLGGQACECSRPSLPGRK